MLNALLTKITGLFDREFLFSSFLPALLFWSVVVLTMVLVAGADACVAWIESWSALQRAAVGTGLSVFIVVFAYVLAGLRASVLRLWAGGSEFFLIAALYAIGTMIQRKRFRKLKTRAASISPWRNEFEAFRARVKAVRKKAGSQMTPKETAAVASVLSQLKTIPASEAASHLKTIVDLYTRHHGDDPLLAEVYRETKDTLLERHHATVQAIQNDSLKLDREFATLESIRPTTLGNIVESYHRYAFSRYRIESEILWPRLRAIMPQAYLTVIAEPQISLDFSLALASLASLYALLSLLAGPWIWLNLYVWIGLAATAIAIALFFYQVAIHSAYQLGELIRGAFDLYRLDLMEALQRDRPMTFLDERTQWEELSQLLVYGTETNFTLRSKP